MNCPDGNFNFQQTWQAIRWTDGSSYNVSISGTILTQSCNSGDNCCGYLALDSSHQLKLNLVKNLCSNAMLFICEKKARN